MKNYFIITGASRGLGEALALNLLKEGNHLVCISRSSNPELIHAAKEKGVPLEYIEHDLSQPQATEELFEGIFSEINVKEVESIHMFNNAGILNPICPIEKYKAEEVSTNIEANLVGPMITTSAFIKFTTDLDIKKRIINISSGAANKAYYGWSAYCASKAGMNHFTRCVAIEQKQRPYPVVIFTFAPGVIDTQMQGEIRKSKEEDFVDLERFIAYKEDGKLLTPDFVAKKAIKLLDVDDYENGAFIDVDEL